MKPEDDTKMDTAEEHGTPDAPEIGAAEAQSGEDSSLGDSTENTEPNSATESKSESGSSRRPLTRSQTGTVPKRRPRADSDVQVQAEPKKRAALARKKQKKSPDPSSRGTAELRDASTPESVMHPSGAASSTSRSQQPSRSASAEAGSHQASPASEERLESHFPRSRATLPVPIPNLTKKSRGRRVPTKDVATVDPNQKEGRLYVCTVEGCGKCFHRGEHLKRHIRSIHTHEKPFKCTFPRCEKFFNRHDNLLQHLKVHREPIFKESSSSATPPKTNYPHSVYQAVAEASNRSYSPDSPVHHQPTHPRTIYSHLAPPTTHYNAYSAPMSFNSSTEPMTLLSNVAVSSLRAEVSSLRTELPNSPTEG